MPEKRGFILFGSPHQSGATARLVQAFFKSVSRRNGMDYGGGLSSENRSLFGLRLLRTKRRMR